MTLERTWRRLAAPVVLAAVLQSPVFADDNAMTPPVQLPNRSPVDLTARQIPAVQGPGAFTTADAPASCGCSSVSFWDRCHGRWVLAKDNWHHRFIGDDGSTVPPLGTFVDAAFQVQIANAEAACMCLHHYDFIDGTSQLNPHGQAQVAKIVTLLPRNFSPVIVEATGTPQLDDARRMRVFQELSAGTFPIPYERVVCGSSTAESLGGPDADKINTNLLKHVEIKGAIDTTAGMTFSSGGSGGGGGGH